MTEKNKRKMLRKITQSYMTRQQLSSYCSEKTQFFIDNEIDHLLNDIMIGMVSEPSIVKGIYTRTPNEVFTIGEQGKNYLETRNRDLLRTYIPIAISSIALVLSAIAIVVSIITANSTSNTEQSVRQSQQSTTQSKNQGENMDAFR